VAGQSTHLSAVQQDFSFALPPCLPWDSPFLTNFGGNAFLRVPQGTHNAWLFSLAYAPTSEIPFPLLGVAYLAHPSEQFLAAIGLPLYLRYRPWDTLTLEGSYMLLRTVHARATYQLLSPVRQ
jgi:hypothetical protein